MRSSLKSFLEHVILKYHFNPRSWLVTSRVESESFPHKIRQIEAKAWLWAAIGLFLSLICEESS